MGTGLNLRHVCYLLMSLMIGQGRALTPPTPKTATLSQQTITPATPAPTTPVTPVPVTPVTPAPTTPVQPVLPNDPLQINVEATIYRTNESGATVNYTVYMEEYRDAVNNRGFVISISNSTEMRYYYDLEAKQGMSLVREINSTPLNQAMCSTVDLNNKNGSYYGGIGITRHPNGQLVISDIADAFQWGAKMGSVYKGKSTVRGIPANMWFHNVSHQGTTASAFNLTYYFSDKHVMPYYGTKAIPLRIEMSGYTRSPTRGSHTYNHVYDFNLIAPLGDKDDSFFATPKGVFCPDRVVPRGSERKYADQYSVSEEFLDPSKMLVTSAKTFFDYKLEMVRTDYQIDDSHSVYGFSDIKVVHDFNQNYQMTVFKNNGTCNVTRIPLKGLTSWDVAPDSKGNAKLLHTRDIPATKHASYQGKRIEKGMPVDVWSTKTSMPGGIISVTEMWYTHPSWKIRSSQSHYHSYSVWAGLYSLQYYKVSHKVLSERQINGYDQYYGPLQLDHGLLTDVFDVPECYSRDSTTNEHLSFQVLDVDEAFIKRKVTRDAMTRAVRGHVTKLTGISSTRVVNVQVYQATKSDVTSPSLLKITFVLRAKLTLTGPDGKSLAANELDNVQTVKTLQSGLATTEGLTLTVTGINGLPNTMQLSKLLSNDMGDISDKVSGKDTSSISGGHMYTAAAMAGLGIGMLVLGALLAVAFGFVIWIKRFDINLPYVTQNNE